jgi:hypothetical protein
MSARGGTPSFVSLAILRYDSWLAYNIAIHQSRHHKASHCSRRHSAAW